MYMFRAIALVLGGFLLAQAVYLVSVKVTHLGVIVPSAIGLVLVAWSCGAVRWQAWLRKGVLRMRLWQWAVGGFAVWLVSLMGYFAMLHGLADATDDAFSPKAIVVLGSSTPNAQPSPVLIERLKLAHRLALMHPQVPVVVSGGTDFRQTIPEARVMADYLQTLGLPADRIVQETQSTSTYENLVFSARVLQTLGIGQDAPMFLVTSDFHTLRAGWIAAKAGWRNVHRAGSPTPLYMRYNAWTREYFATLSGLLLREF